MGSRILGFALSAAVAVAAIAPASAALAPGAKAPDFAATATQGGKHFQFKVSEQLKKGPLVLYFYPAAFTPGCTIEAHLFAEATDEFAANGATVVGVSADSLDQLDKFSVQECQSKFPLVGVKGDVMKAYDSVLARNPERSSRTSYVIGQDGRIVFAHSDMAPDKHVELTLDAVKKLKARR